MHALRFTAPAADSGTTEVAEVPVPEPGDGEIAVDVGHAGINFSDVMVRRGDALHRDRYPIVPGMEAAGTVRAVGPGVTGLAVGDRVVAFTPGLGALAEVVIAREALVAPVPHGLDLALAAAAPTALASAVLIIDDVARLRAGETVLAHSAAGAVGHALAQLARARGASAVIGTVGSPTRVEQARRAGYDSVLVRGADLAEQVPAATGGRGADVVLDPLGIALLETDLAFAAPGARIVIFGNAAGGPMEPLPSAAQLMAGNVSLAGFRISTLSAAAPERVRGAIRRALELLAEGTLTIDVTVTDGLASAAIAQQALADGRGGVKHVIAVA